MKTFSLLVTLITLTAFAGSAMADNADDVRATTEQQHMERLPTQNLAALEAYYRGYVFWEQYTASGFEEAVDQFEEAISLDPDFAKAHALLGRSLILQNAYGGLPIDLQIAKAEPHIQKALELDDTLSEAYVALGYMKRRQGDYEEAESAYKKAVELDPNNAELYNTYSHFIANYLGDASEGAQMRQKAYDLDPKRQGRLARSYEWSGQLDEARELRESIAAKNPESVGAQRELGNLYSRYLGRFDDAIVAYRKAYFLDPKNPDAPSFISAAFLSLGDQEQAVFWSKIVVGMLPDSERRIAERAWILKLNGDDSAREQFALDGLTKYPKNGFLLGHVVDLDIASGQPGKSRSRYKEAFPSLFEPSVKIHGSAGPWHIGNTVWRAKDLARVSMATGEQEQANYLITESLASARTMPPRLRTLRLEASLHAIAGDERQALAAIRRYFEAGGSPYGLMLEDELKPFQDHSEYREMAAEAEARMAAQLKRIREMEANGELAPIPELPAD